MDYLAKARCVIETEIDGRRRMSGRLDARVEEAARILQHTLDQRGKIVVVGVGKSGNIGHKIAATLNSTGATAVVLDTVHGATFTDHLALVRGEGGWRIVGKTYTTPTALPGR